MYASQNASLLLFSARDALRGAEGRREELEAEVERVTQQVEEMEKVLQQKEEEVSRLKEGLEEHQERQLAEAKARQDNSRYASNSLCVEITVILSVLSILSFFP